MNQTDPDNWEPCSPGVIQEAAVESFGRRALLKILGTGAVLGALGAGTTVGVLLSKQRSKPAPITGGMACITVQDYLTAYADDKLSKELSKQIFDHLMNCDTCNVIYMEIRNCPDRRQKPAFKPCPCGTNPPTP